MKARRSLITLISVFFLALACAFGVMNFNKSNAMAAETVNAPVAGVDTIVDAGAGLVLDTNADVRISGKAIKFSTTLTKDFHDELAAQGDVTYIATMNIVGEDNVLALKFAAPEFEGATAKLEAYLNFDGASETVLAQALTAEFETATYALVGDTYYKATNSNEVERSMRAVANSEYLNWEEGVGYEKADLTDFGYFTIGLHSDKEFAVVDTNDKLYVRIPGAPAEQAAIYVDDVKVAATYDEETDKYVVEDFATEGNYVTVFTAEGAAYSSNIATGAIAINDLPELTAAFNTTTNIEGYYVLTSDIAVGTWASVENNMYGTFNGLGYALTNYKNSDNATQSALFSNVYGATMRNIVMSTQEYVSNATNSGATGGIANNGGVLLGYVYADVPAQEEKYDEESGVTTPATEGITYGDTVLDNVIVYMPAAGYNTAPINVQNHAMTVKDSLFVTGRITNFAATGGGIAYNNGAEMTTENTFVVTAPSGRLALNANNVKNATVYETLGALYNADLAGTADVSDYQWDNLQKLGVKFVNAENIAEITTAVAGYFIVTEDIDMTDVTLKVPEGAAEGQTATYAWSDGDRGFHGTLDGADHTLYNIYNDLTNVTGAGNYSGFLSFGWGTPLVTNINMNVLTNGNRGGLFGRTRSAQLNECAIKLDGAFATYGGGLFAVVDGNVFIKDSFFYMGSSAMLGRTGWLASSEAIAGKFGVDNFYVVNVNPLMTSAVAGQADTARISQFANINAAATVYSDADPLVTEFDYYYFTDGADYVDLEANTLPENVKAGIAKIGAIQELNEDTLAQAKTATGGYWYLTDDLDVTGNGILFDYRKSFGWGTWNGTKYTYTEQYGANIHLDGRGHTISGITGSSVGNTAALVREGAGSVVFKNLKLEGTMAGTGGNSQLFVGIIRENQGVNNITIENVFVDMAAANGNSSGSLIVSWSTMGTNITMKNVFVNYGEYTGGYLLTGHVWTGTITFTDVFFAGVPAESALAKDVPTYKDADGNTITPGGTGEFDFACTIAETLEDLKNDGMSWDYILSDLPDLVALDPEFFA